MRLAVDMSSFMWTSLLVGKDKEGIEVNHNGRDVWVNTAGYGYEHLVNMLTAAMNDAGATPIDMVMVFEGKDSKRKRTMLDPLYKSGDSRAPEQYIQFNLLKENIKKTFRDLGAIAISQAYVEGDDVLGYLARNAEEDLMIATNDNDLVVLNGTNDYGAKVQVRINGEIGVNKYGPFDTKLVTLYKALVGDTSDKIKGVKGFGAAAWLNVNVRYDDDGCFELMDLIHRGRRDEVATIAEQQDCKYLRLIVEHWVDAVKCLKLATIHHEWVNTVDHQLEWEAGVVISATTDERLKPYRASKRLVTSATYAQALAFLKNKLVETKVPAFDIETSTPEDSDDWLAAQGDPEGVDVIGSYLCGFSITFGPNMQYTYYVSVKHKDTDNASMRQAREMIEALFDKEIAIQNTSFELTVLYGDEAKDEDGSLWRDHWRKYGNFGFIPKVLDTKIEAAYVDENVSSGLKQRSANHLGYTQVSYKETMTIDGQLHKMHQVPATHVFSYGCDDTICTGALHNFYRLHMQLDHHWKVYKEVELDAAFLHAKMFYDGIPISLAKLSELAQEDEKIGKDAWATLREYLISKGWDGTTPPVYSSALTAKEIKQAYSIVTGQDSEEADDDEEAEPAETVKDPVLSSRVRTAAKFPALLEQAGQEELAKLISAALSGDAAPLTQYVQARFDGEPKFKMSNKQMCHLLYTVMALPVRVRNKPTATMKAKGIREGNPKGDDLALQYAIEDAKTDEEKAVLKAIQLLQMVKVRKSLFYEPYPKLLHWKTGKIHGSHNQAATNTRRASASKPNLQQLSVKEKMKGFVPRIREAIMPHKPGAVVVSMDFSAQELRIIAEQCRDDNMLACYIGDNKKDMHSLTGCAIAQKAEKDKDWSYNVFIEALEAGEPEQQRSAAVYRGKGKGTNFAVSFGAMADKIALTLHISPEEAQTYIDAREATFPGEVVWKKQVVKETLATGTSKTLMGAVRHLASAINSEDRYTASKAERQGVNFRVQGSAAEQTKLAEGRFWRSGIFEKMDAQYYAPIHDELVMSVMLDQLPEFIQEGHPYMVSNYANMFVPIESSIGFGWNFGVLAEIGTTPSEAAIVAGIAKLKEANGSTCP